MIAVFREYLKEKANYTEQELDVIVAAAVIRKVRRRQYLLQQGDVWKHNAFVTKGCLRTYTVDEKGAEHIINFAVENWWIGDRESLRTGEPSIYNIDAIEDTEVALLSKEAYDTLCVEIPAFNDMVNAILEKSFRVSQHRIHTFISLTAEEKYRNFLERLPHLATRLPQSMIASYLGMTAETLSRIRKLIVHK